MASPQSILEDRHLWIHSGNLVAKPGLDDVGGLAGLHMPPICAAGTSVRLRIDGKVVPATRYEWRPGECVRFGKWDDLEIESSLTVDRRGVSLLTVRLISHRSANRTVEVSWEVDARFGLVPSEGWGWVPPSADEPFRTEATGTRAVLFTSEADPSRRIAVACGRGLRRRGDSAFRGTFDLNPGRTKSISLALAVGGNDAQAMAAGAALAPNRARAMATRGAADRLRGFLVDWPELRSSNRTLEDFYWRGLLTFQTCVWDSDDFAQQPSMAESGIDGGAVCTYLWGIAYIAKLLALCRPDLLRAHIVQALKSEPFAHYAYTPLTGKPIGPWYSYNQFCIVWCAYHYALLSGDFAFLNEQVDGRSVFEWAQAHALYRDDLSKPPQLIDYGDDSNLLELRRTDAYRHFVPSPNAERCWCMRAVDRMAQWAGRPEPGLSSRADQLATVIRERLWREDLGWFGTLDASGAAKVCASIQVFDMLRFDVPDEHQTAALLKHLNEREFLSAYGVHSLAKTDPGYDPSDVDWGGPGVYTGDAPELVEDLYHAGAFAEGDDVLRRILWWGERLPYYPQAIRADALDYRKDGRANVVVALKACEAVVFGLLGLEVSADGWASVRPHLPAWLNDFEISALPLRGQTVAVRMDRNGFSIVAGGKESRHRTGERVRVR